MRRAPTRASTARLAAPISRSASAHRRRRPAPAVDRAGSTRTPIRNCCSLPRRAPVEHVLHSRRRPPCSAAISRASSSAAVGSMPKRARIEQRIEQRGGGAKDRGEPRRRAHDVGQAAAAGPGWRCSSENSCTPAGSSARKRSKLASAASGRPCLAKALEQQRLQLGQPLARARPSARRDSGRDASRGSSPAPRAGCEKPSSLSAARCRGRPRRR